MFPFSETEFFLNILCTKVDSLKTFRDTIRFEDVQTLPLSEAIEEVLKLNINLNNIDFEWEALLSKQCHSYNNLCAAYKIDSMAIKVHLFKAKEAEHYTYKAKNKKNQN